MDVKLTRAHTHTVFSPPPLQPTTLGSLSPMKIRGKAFGWSQHAASITTCCIAGSVRMSCVRVLLSDDPPLSVLCLSLLLLSLFYRIPWNTSTSIVGFTSVRWMELKKRFKLTTAKRLLSWWFQFAQKWVSKLMNRSEIVFPNLFLKCHAL